MAPHWILFPFLDELLLCRGSSYYIKLLETGCVVSVTPWLQRLQTAEIFGAGLDVEKVVLKPRMVFNVAESKSRRMIYI